MKKFIKKTLDIFSKYKYLILFALSFGIIDIAARLPYNADAKITFFSMAPTLFTISIIFLFMAIYIVLPKKIKIGYVTILLLVFNVLLVTHTIYKEHFGNFFSFKNLILAKEGLTYFWEYLHSITFISIITILISVILIIFSIKCSNKYKFDKYICIVCVVVSVTCFGFGIKKLGPPIDENEKTFIRSSRDYFDNYEDTNSSMMISGLYVYTFKDFYYTNLKKEKVDIKKSTNEINGYFDSYENIDTNNKYTGMFKDKNLILVMMENIDTWMINEETMPNLTKIMNGGINFNNHYSPSYTDGYTYQTEFIVNTGYVPKFYANAPAYAYASNVWPYALPNLFADKDYDVNSYHTNPPDFYNRGTNHKNWGYATYSDYISMNIFQDNFSMDRYLAETGYDSIVKDDKFMSFVITYSGHQPFSKDKRECSENLEIIKKTTKSDDINYLCALSQAYETDLFFKILVEKLEKDNKLNDTVLVIYSDHYTYSYEYRDIVSKLKNETDENLLQKVPFMIWNNNITHKQVNEVTSTIDVLPTIANLFGIDYEPKYYIGTDALGNNHDNIVFFSDYSWYDGTNYYKDGKLLKGNATDDYIKEVNSNLKNKIDFNNNIISINYYGLLN